MILIPTTNVFAEDLILPEELTTKQEVKYYEYDQKTINESIKKDNEKAEIKWNEMLKNEGITENDPSIITVNNNFDFNNLIVPNAFKSATASKHNLFTGEDYIFNSTFNTIQNGNGVDIIGEVYSVDVWAGNSKTRVSNKTIRYKKIDAGRTIAANYNFKGGYKNSKGKWLYGSRTFYVEFRATGSAVVY